ncbi:hypothetical protein V7138_10290 [Bacillus sp. JJ1533]|uniref:hypothetical protein n=1 Tax=Bacillus sp. JJ1533 TaxID=3122959 RepID=UPI003000CF3B
MNLTRENVKKVFSFMDVKGSWDLTDNENEARIDDTYRLTTLEELHDLVAGCGYVFEGKILTSDGVVQWYTETIFDEWGEEENYICEYRLVS